MACVPYDDLCERPGACVDSLPRATGGGVHGQPVFAAVPVTHRGQTIAHIRRLPPVRGAAPEGVEVVQVRRMRTDRDARAEYLREGGVFVIGCQSRRIAVVEGVKA